MHRLFIDSDIIIDLLAKRDHFYEAAELMTVIKEKKASAFTSPIILANVDYIITKYSNRSNSKKAIKNLLKIFSILSIDEKIVDKAIESNFSDFEDAIQYYTAEKHKMDFIITRNKKDYVKGIIKVITAKEYLEMNEFKL